MADFFEQFGLNLLSLSSDPDPGDTFSIYQAGTSAGSLAAPVYPQTYSLSVGTLTLLSANGDFKVTLANNNSNPADGVTQAVGTIYFKLIDSNGAISANIGQATINLRSQSGGTAPTPVTSGLLAWWKPDAGVTLAGSNVSQWTDQQSSRLLTAVGAPVMTTGPSGAAMVAINNNAGFTGTNLSGLPTGAASRSIQMFWRPRVPYYAGAGYGSNATDQAFTNAVDDAGEVTCDFRNGRLASGMRPLNQYIATTVTYDGTTVKVYIGDVLVASQAKVLATGASLINICRTFSGFTTQADVGDVLIYGRELTLADVVITNNYLRQKFVGSASITDPTFSAATAVAQTSFTANVTVGASFGVVAWAARTSSTTMTEAEILAGTGAISYGLAISNGTGTVAIPVTGGAASTAYYVNIIVYGIAGGKSTVVKSSSVTTTAAPVANPTLSAASLTSTGQTTLVGSVTTDRGNGTLEYGLMLSTALDPTLTQLEAGTDGNGNPLIGGLRTQAITASGAQAIAITGATAATTYKVAYGQRDGSSNGSNIVTASATTDAATVTTSLTPDFSYTTMAAVKAKLAEWAANPGGTAPTGKTPTQTRVVALSAPIGSGDTLSGYDFSAITGGVIFRGTGPYGYNSSYPYEPTCGSDINGTLTVQNCRNLQVYGITARKMVVTGCTGFKRDRVSIHSKWSTTRSQPSVAGPGVDYTNCPGVVDTRSHIGGFNTLSATFRNGCDDGVFEKFYIEQFSNDMFKCLPGSSTLARIKEQRGWAGRDNLSNTSAHSDFTQNQAGVTPDYYFWGNCAIEGATLNGVSFQGGLWQSNTNVSDNCIASQNILAIRGQNALATAAGTNDTCSYNTLLYSEHGAHGSVQPAGELVPKISGTWSTLEYNISCRANSGGSNSGGTGSIIITCGVNFNTGGVATLNELIPLFQGFPGEQTYIDTVKPVAGAVTHWNYSGQKVGAYLRAQEIFQDGIHPGNDGWPNAGRFRAEYDPNNTLGMSYDPALGFDSDGNAATAAPTSLTINNPTLPLYDRDPYGVGRARITFTGTHNKDGSALRIKIVNNADASTVVDWATFTAGAGGAWTTTVDVPHGWIDLRAVVDAASNAAVTATQTQTFRVGYIVAVQGQSLVQRPFTNAASSAALSVPAKTLWVKHNSASGSASAAPVEVSGSSILNLRRMACTVAAHFDAPLMMVQLSESGTGLGETVNAEEVADRSWYGTVETPVLYIRSNGSDVAAMLWHWAGNDATNGQTQWERWAAPALLKQQLNGLGLTSDGSGLQPYTSGSVAAVANRGYTPVHFFWDLTGSGQGLFNPARTKLVSWHNAGWFNPPGTNGGYATNDVAKSIEADYTRQAMNGTAMGQISLKSVPGWTGQYEFGGHIAMPGGTHVGSNTGEVDGEALVAVYMAIAAGRATGAMLSKEPRILSVTAGSNYWDVVVNLPHGGNLSTPYAEYLAGSYAGSFEATNWIAPTATSEAQIPALHAVQGFAVWTSGVADWEGFTTAITDAGSGTVPNRTGTIRVTLNSGTTTGKTLSFGYAFAAHVRTLADANASRPHTHLPIETRTHVSGAGYGFPVVRHQNEKSIAIW
jgi:hypothetical protein